MSDIESIRGSVFSALGDQPVARRWQTDVAVLTSLEACVVVICVVAAIVIAQPLPNVRWVSATLLLGSVVHGTVVAVRPFDYAARLRSFGLYALALCGVLLSRGPFDVVLHGPECAALELLLSLFPAVVTALVLRRFAYRPAESFVGGLAAGGTGLLGLELTCPIASTDHVLAYHVAPWLAVGLGFLWARSRMRSKTFAP